MSGGHFDLNHRFNLGNIIGELDNLATTEPCDHGNVVPDDILTDVETLRDKLQECEIRLTRLDYYLSGDDSEESYHKRLKEEL